MKPYEVHDIRDCSIIRFNDDVDTAIWILEHSDDIDNFLVATYYAVLGMAADWLEEKWIEKVYTFKCINL